MSSSEPSASWPLTLVLLTLALPPLALLVGLLLLALAAFMPEGVLRHECSRCGASGRWRRRNSLGYHLCDRCAGPRQVENPSPAGRRGL